jgi:hypothetical protein
VGVVRFYSHDNVENTNKMIAPANTQDAKSQAASKTGQNVTRKSRIVNDMDDF